MLSIDRTKLESKARKAGYDLSQMLENDWLRCESSQTGRHIWLRYHESHEFVYCAVETLPPFHLRHMVMPTFPDFLPKGAYDIFSVNDNDLIDFIGQIYALPPDTAEVAESLEAHQMAQNINASIWKKFIERGLTSTRECLVEQRTCQDLFREGLMKLYQNRCMVTGLECSALLVASHIKPWADCSDDRERISIYNGLLLSVHIDKLFDKGFISFEDNGNIMISSRLTPNDLNTLNICSDIRIHIFKESLHFMQYHRANVFLDA